MFSYELLAEKLIDVANIDWSGRESQKNSCRYGMEMLISMVVNFGLVLLTGLLLGSFKEVLIYLIAWASLRFFSGGRHAPNHRSCSIMFLSIMVIVIYTCKYLTIRVDMRNFEIIAFALAFILNILFAGNKVAEQSKKIKNKRISLIILTTLFAIVMIGNMAILNENNMDLQYMALIITGAVLAESIFLLPLHKAEKEN